LRFSFPRRRRLLQQEDGESQNIFSWTEWMRGWMDEKSFMTTTSFTSLNQCLMHRCVYLTVHITKLQLQTTFPKPLYIPHSACIHRDPGRWKSWCLHSLWPVR
jgi:hypothetical protein